MLFGSATHALRISRFHRIVCVFFILSLSTDAKTQNLADSCALHPVLLEEFNEQSIAAYRLGPARWTAHTPWNGDFGDARFLNPGPNGPFSVENGILSITARKGGTDGKWRSGLIAAADGSGLGFGTRYGYFEARMKLPPGPGTWPAFWLAALKQPNKDDAAGSVEIDVIEYYGQFTAAYRSTVQVWFKDQAKHRATGQQIDVATNSLVTGFHTYGVDLSPQHIIFFLDGKEVWRQPTPPELTGPMYPLVNLALGSGWPIDHTPNPSELLVDYVRVYGRGAGPPAGCTPGLSH
jgi:beta-glucanase (GH16 family)